MTHPSQKGMLMTLQTPATPLPRQDWSYDQYFLAQINKNKKKHQDKNGAPLKTN
ncbi:hypothetical protein [Methylomonas sp. MgM2]